MKDQLLSLLVAGQIMMAIVVGLLLNLMAGPIAQGITLDFGISEALACVAGHSRFFNASLIPKVIHFNYLSLSGTGVGCLSLHPG